MRILRRVAHDSSYRHVNPQRSGQGLLQEDGKHGCASTMSRLDQCCHSTRDCFTPAPRAPSTNEGSIKQAREGGFSLHEDSATRALQGEKKLRVKATGLQYHTVPLCRHIRSSFLSSDLRPFPGNLVYLSQGIGIRVRDGRTSWVFGRGSGCCFVRMCFFSFAPSSPFSQPLSVFFVLVFRFRHRRISVSFCYFLSAFLPASSSSSSCSTCIALHS